MSILSDLNPAAARLDLSIVKPPSPDGKNGRDVQEGKDQSASENDGVKGPGALLAELDHGDDDSPRQHPQKV